jgi:hypothetical protein
MLLVHYYYPSSDKMKVSMPKVKTINEGNTQAWYANVFVSVKTVHEAL